MTKPQLSSRDPDYTGGISKTYAEDLFYNEFVNKLSNLQYTLFAAKTQSLLIVLHGVDTSGKDGTIRHAMKAFNPQSCKAFSFKKPNKEELSNDYLWRIHKKIPAKGEIIIFNRSHYESVIEERVRKLTPEDVWSKRYNQINEFEKYLFENNVRLIKFFLHISKDKQKKRLKERMDDPNQHWKFSESDIKGRKSWNEYILAYEEMLENAVLKIFHGI